MISRPLALALICAATLGLAVAPSVAQDAKSKAKPALSVSSRAIKIQIEIDPKLRADAQLY